MDAAFTLAWQHAAGQVFPEDLPMAAAELLAAGDDSPALCDLAGRSRGEPTGELEELFREAMAELGVPVPEEALAGRCLLRHLAAGVAEGRLAPKEAAGTAWHGMDEFATEVERRFARAAKRLCCADCLVVVEDGDPEAFRAWEQEVSAAADAVAVATDDPRGWTRRR
ncbi:hypothetical protein ABZX88_31945 [Kitasatospora aureofaciens]|uniref:hypothetical protein n=1 Tax=Kitasatospora aureofaciens TaxID=1894 RepID=UPI0033A5F25F